MKRRVSLVAIALTVAGLSLLPYLQVGAFGLINLDDYFYVRGSPVATGVSLANMHWVLVTGAYQGIWMPATWVSYMLDGSLLGGGAAVHHWVNAGLHAANAGLVFMLLCEILMRTPRPGFPASWGLFAAASAALLWALHPLRVEPVAWVASRKDVLSLFWELLALIGWLRGAQAAAQSQRAAVYRALSVACFAVAAMAKPTAMTFPVLAGLLEYLVMRKVRFGALFWPFLLALGVGAIAQYAQRVGGASLPLADVPFLARLANAAAAFGIYCWKTILPAGLAVPYLHAWPAWPQFLLPGVAICLGYGGVLVWSAWRGAVWDAWARPASRSAGCGASVARAQPAACAVFVGLAWFLVAVAPTLGLANFGYHSHADRFTYLPGVGFAVTAAVATTALCRCGQLVRSAAVAGLVTLLGVWCALSWSQAQHWRNNTTLFSHTVEMTGEANYIAQLNLAIDTFGATGSAAAALPYVEAAFRHDRQKCRTHQSAYVLFLASVGRLEEASAETRDFSAWLERKQNQGIESAAITKAAPFGHEPAAGPRGDDYAGAMRVCHATIAYYRGDRDLASEHAQAALQMNRGSIIAHYLCGLMALEEGRVRETLEHWRASAKDDVFFGFLKARTAKWEAHAP